ncbi:MAG TPA: DUF2232 domain-containing protein [Gemmatimonadales bacterium]|nr:DUF2232 domain-containing protein [Gemmatimonadales bacterium]
MMDTVAPVSRRRIPRGLFGALVAFLFLPFPSICLTGPLAGCLILARPRGLREWSWLAAAVALSALGFTAANSLAQEVFFAYGVAFTGSFLALRIWRPGPVLARTTVAAVDTAALAAIGAWGLGLRWEIVRSELTAEFQNAVSLVTSGTVMPGGQMDQLRETMAAMAAVYPGIAILGAMAGGVLASAVAWHITDGRTGPEPALFRHFRFNDHLIWGAILNLALVLLPLPAPFSDFVANAMVIWLGLYVARGGAIAGFTVGRWPMPLKVSLALAAVLLLPYALGGLLLLGLADTWLDFRRAPPPPTQGAIDD